MTRGILGEALLEVEEKQSLMVVKKNISIRERQRGNVRVQQIGFHRLRIGKTLSLLRQRSFPLPAEE